MIYSRFDEQAGVYEVFEDDRPRALNADLPVPRLGTDAGRVGVPATEAGRELPGGVRRAGTSWHARGVVVRPLRRRAPLGGLAGVELGSVAFPLALAAGLVLALYYVAPRLGGANR